MNKTFAIKRLRSSRSFSRESAFKQGKAEGKRIGEAAVCHDLTFPGVMRIIELAEIGTVSSIAPTRDQIELALDEVGSLDDFVEDAFDGLESCAREWADPNAYKEGFCIGFCEGVKDAWESIADEVNA